MTPPPLAEEALAQATTAEIHSALFAQFVTGQAQMTLMLLGKFPNPQTGQVEAPIPEAAKLFIDQLEMIEAKTHGNLTPDETRLLRQMLIATQMTFAEVMDSQLSGESATEETRPGGPGETPTAGSPNRG